MTTNLYLRLIAVILAISISALGQPSSDYRLVFEDEFSGGGLNSYLWRLDDCVTVEHGLMLFKPEAVTVQSGQLVITVSHTQSTCGDLIADYTSGNVWSEDRFKYGYYEMNAKIPKGLGAWSAFWLYSSGLSSYQEMDVFEYCGCRCNEFQSGYFYEEHSADTSNYYNTEHPNNDIVIDNGCDNFHKYGVEWTPTKIKFYLDGLLKKTYNNYGVHDPLNLIFGCAVGGGYEGCGTEICGSQIEDRCIPMCELLPTTTFEVKDIKVWQLKNKAIYFLGDNELCVNGTTRIKAPMYPNTTYNWTTNSSGIEIYWPAGDTAVVDGVKYNETKIRALAPGIHVLKLTATFPSGYIEIKNFTVKVNNAAPPTPTDISFVANNIDCCYECTTPWISTATSYIWSFGISSPNSETTKTNNTTDCILDIFGGNTTVTVRAATVCT
jgi:beta-glucanase (GH16 family)